MTGLYVAAGGALGAFARYALGGWILARTTGTFPWPTPTINVLGSFLLGMSIPALGALPVPGELRALITVGVLGGFTTFSAFSYEAIALLQQAHWLRFLAYALGSVVAGLAALLIGLRAGALAFAWRTWP